MNYEDAETRALTHSESSFGKKFRAHTDVANCFGSVYTHSLEWAIQGFKEAKKGLFKSKPQHHWSSGLDNALRKAKRNETAGLPIGPATSSIAVEIILAAVDLKLSGKFSFVRYIDDYTALCETHEDAEEFIRLLSKELAAYKLALNLTKTSIVELPVPLQEEWVATLTNALPPTLYQDGTVAFMNTREAFHFLDHAVRLNNSTLDGSVLKFAVGAIATRVRNKAASNVFQYVLNLSWHYPILLPFLEKLDVSSDYYAKEDLVNKLDVVLLENIAQRRSDGMCWALYYLERLQGEPSKKAIEKIIDSGDCVAITMLSRFEVGILAVVEFAKGLISENLYELDEYWFLLYELYRRGKIDNPYKNENSFDLLKKYNVDFFCEVADKSLAEKYCNDLSNPFIEDGDMPAFDKWMAEANE